MSKGERSARAAGKVSVAVLISRVLGLVRDQVFAKLFGAGIYNDAWLVALRIPNLLRDLFAEGALSAAFVPTFTEHLQKKGLQAAWHLANLVLSGLLVSLGLLTLLFFFFPDFFVHLLAAGYDQVPGKVEVTSNLIRIMAPFLMFIAMASVVMAMLNTLNHFFLPALAPAAFNIALILSGFFLVPEFERAGALPIYAMGFGALIGGLLQYAVQVPSLRREGFRFRFRVDFQHPGVRRIGRLMAPAVVGISAVQLNVVVNTLLASYLQDNGPVSWLNYAFRIIYLPIGLFGVAVGVVNLKEVSVFAAKGLHTELKETVANSLKLIAFLGAPSTVGLIVLAQPVVRVLFERGDFTAADTLFTSYAVMAYAFGLFSYSCIKVYVPTFYALDNTQTPVRISLTAVAVNLTINLLLIFLLPAGYKYIGLAAGTALSVSLNGSLLALSFRKRMGTLREFRVVGALFTTLVSALLMGAVVFALNRYLHQRWGEMGFGLELGSLVLCIAAGVFCYALASWALKSRELRMLMGILRSR
jgi:putative peptidoglycan lipid II flippase